VVVPPGAAVSVRALIPMASEVAPRTSTAATSIKFFLSVPSPWFLLVLPLFKGERSRSRRNSAAHRSARPRDLGFWNLGPLRLGAGVLEV
jgi:hypothetical protein